MIWVVHPGSRFWFFMDAGSRGQKSNGSRIRSTDCLYALSDRNNWGFTFLVKDFASCQRGALTSPPLVLLSLYPKLNVYNHLNRESKVSNFYKRMKMVKIAMALECFTSWSAVSLSYTWGAGIHGWCNGCESENTPWGGHPGGRPWWTATGEAQATTARAR